MNDDEWFYCEDCGEDYLLPEGTEACPFCDLGLWSEDFE